MPGRSRRGSRGSRGLLVGAIAVLVVGVVIVGYAALRLGTGGHSTASSGANPGGSSSVAPSTVATPGTGTPAPSGDTSCVSATIAKLSLEQQVGQLLMIGTPITDPTAIVATLRQYHLGSVFLAGRSTQSSASLLAAIQTIQKAAVQASGMPAQVALDQEGGTVQTLSGNDFPKIPSAVTQGTWSTQTLHDRTVDWAQRLAKAGLTMDLAPVSDTVPAGLGNGNPPIGALDRQYGSDPAKVAQAIATVVSAAQGAGITTTLKHFPGLGRVRYNTDTSANAVDNTATVDDPYLQPFAAGITAGTGAVMVSSAKYPKLDTQNIAAFSAAIITDLLRKKLGFTGVVISDDLGAAAAVKSVPLGERAVRFITAGGDVVLTVRTADAGTLASALIAEAKKSPAFAARVADAAGHVVAGKIHTGLVSCVTPGH